MTKNAARLRRCCGLLIGALFVLSAAPGPAAPKTLPRVDLRSAVQRALARNPTAAVARAEIQRAEALVRQARASSLPVLTATVTYTRLDDERSLGDRVVAGANSVNAAGSLAVPLLAVQRWVQWRNARDTVEVVRAGAADTGRLLAAAAARACLAVIAQHRAVEVSRRARDTAEAHHRFTQKRFAGGAGTRIDVVRAGQELATDRAQVEVAQGALERAQEALGVVLAADGAVDCVGDQVSSLHGIPSLSNALAAVKQRGDLRATALRAGTWRKQVRDSWTDFLPTLTAAFQPFFQDPPSLVQPELGWQLQVLLSVWLYDGGLRYGLQRERRAQLAAAQAQLDGLERQARSEVRAAFAVMKRADRALAAAREAARLGNEAFALATEAYRAGATTSLDVIDASRRARDADTAAVIAEDNARQARLDVLVTSGRFP